MCGICGVAAVSGSDAQPIEASDLRAMTDAIWHRGPDDAGHRIAPGVALGMRRLKVIDLEGSHQPRANETESVWTVFNGEIFNFPQLRRDLERRGHRLATRGDTETIVHLYEDHGVDFVRHLRGMFAIAVWDETERRLVLARDRMGVKPLYYALGPWGLAFASEIKSLMAGGLIEPGLDDTAAELFLAYGYVPGPRTLFAGVSKLTPGSVLVWQDGRVTSQERYWEPLHDTATRTGGWQEDEEELLLALTNAVEMRMISDVPLGVMLSGGLDSSLVTALMAKASKDPVKTFSIGFSEDPEANELADARRVAERLGTDHHEILTSASDHPDLLEEALWHLEEPITDLSFLGFMLLSRLAREHVTVVLCGQAADELLGGYAKHAVARTADLVAHAPSAALASGARLAQMLPGSHRARRGLLALATDDPVERMLAMSRVVQPEQRATWLSPARVHALYEQDVRDVIRSRLPAGRRSALTETLYLDQQLALVDLMFVYFDKMSMATSLEVRVPFADHDVVRVCMSFGDDRKISRGRRKVILKRISDGLVDEEIINKRKRAFFRGASSTWLRTNTAGLVRETLLGERALSRGFLNAGAVDRALSTMAGGKRDNEGLLGLFMLEYWHQQFVDSDGFARRRVRDIRRATKHATI